MPSRRPARDVPARAGDAAPTPDRRRIVVTAWIRTVRGYMTVAKQLERSFRAYGLTPPQFDILATLHRHPGISQQELADRMLVSKGNVSFLLRGMASAGWVERCADPGDARFNRLHVTAAARDLFAHAVAEHDRVLAEALAPLDDDALRTIASLMARLGPPPW